MKILLADGCELQRHKRMSIGKRQRSGLLRLGSWFGNSTVRRITRLKTSGTVAHDAPRPAEIHAAQINTRLDWVDHLRVVLTMLVVAHHAGQPYGPTGGDWPIFNTERAALLGPFFSVNAAFFMGLFFLLAGAFVPGAYDRKGGSAFLRDRMLRLGLPLVVFALFVFGPITYAMRDGAQLPPYTPASDVAAGTVGVALDGGGRSFWHFLLYEYIGGGQINVGHLWFVLHLLIYAYAYAAWRGLRRNVPRSTRPAPPRDRMILGYTLALAAVTACVRIVYPIDTWVRLFGVIPIEVAHLPQYLSLFIIGLVAARGEWLQRMPVATGMRWLAIGGAAAAVRYAYSLGIGQLLPTPIIAGGGLDWRSLVWSSWEALICVGLCVGLPVLFRTYATHQSRWLRGLAANAYAVYIYRSRLRGAR